MQAQVVHLTNRGIVPSTVGGDEHNAESLGSASSVPSGEPADELELRRRFESLLAAHLPAVRVRARQLCRSHYDPEDLIQDALLRAFRSRSHLEDLTRMRAWLLTIVTNTFIDETRKQRRRPDHVELVDVPTPDPSEPTLWDHVQPDHLRSAIDQLPDDVRDTYQMFTSEGLDYAAISAVQQIPEATVGSRIFRARKRLRVLLTITVPTGRARSKAL